MESGWLGTGPKVARFEKDFREYKDASYSVAVNSCTAALHVSLLCADIGPKDEVITTPLTFCATVNAIIQTGATPVLADIDLETMNINPDEIRKKITPRTKAILPVHFAGRSCEMDEICTIAKNNNLTIIEDCAHAVETEYHNVKAGNFGRFGCFSFYPNKNITTGEGGMILAKNENDANRLKILSLHGMSKDAWKRFSDEGYKHYQVVDSGYKYNMTDIQASIGIHQLKRIESSWERRKEIWNKYNSAFENLPLKIPAPVEKETRHAYHLYTVLIDKYKNLIERDEFLEKMTKENVGVGVHYLSIPEHKYYQEKFGWKNEDYPNAMKVGQETVSLPISPKLTDEEVDYIIKIVKKIINKFS
jgi:dTDP-4-amino-4,6-dideoxygalactose transaminase